VGTFDCREEGEHLISPLGVLEEVVVLEVLRVDGVEVLRVDGVELMVVRVVAAMELVWEVGVIVCCLENRGRVLVVVASLLSCFFANIFWYSVILNGILVLLGSEIIVNLFSMLACFISSWLFFVQSFSFNELLDD